MSGYGGYGGAGNGGGRGGYGQPNPYDQAPSQYGQGPSNPYASTSQASGNPYGSSGPNPYAQQAPPSNQYGGRPSQPPTSQTDRYGSQPSGNGGQYQNYSQGNQQSTSYGQGDNMEMGAMNGQGGSYGGSAPPARNPNAILNECRDIDTGIDSIQRNLDRLRFLQQRAIDDPDASQNTQTNRELDSLSSETMTLYRNFGARIKSIKQQKESGDPKNRPQVGRVDRKLKSAINEYQQVEKEFRQKLAAQMERQYRIVRPDASDQEVREAVQDTSNNQVFSQALMTSNRRGQSQSALRAVQGRHEAIQKIERQMVELAQLFQDMEVAIIEQEPAVMDIEQKGEDTVVNLGKGNEQLDTAIVSARSARKKKWICFWISIILLLIIIGVIVGVVFYLKGKKPAAR